MKQRNEQKAKQTNKPTRTRKFLAEILLRYWSCVQARYIYFVAATSLRFFFLPFFYFSSFWNLNCFFFCANQFLRFSVLFFSVFFSDFYPAHLPIFVSALLGIYLFPVCSLYLPVCLGRYLFTLFSGLLYYFLSNLLAIAS